MDNLKELRSRINSDLTQYWLLLLFFVLGMIVAMYFVRSAITEMEEKQKKPCKECEEKQRSLEHDS